MSAVLELHDVTKVYAAGELEVKALAGVTLDIHEGAFDVDERGIDASEHRTHLGDQVVDLLEHIGRQPRNQLPHHTPPRRRRGAHYRLAACLARCNASW